MSFALLGKKIGMSQVYDDENNVVPVTVVEAGPCSVVQVKTVDKDGYSAVQIGFNPDFKKPQSIKPLAGHCEKHGVEPQAVLSEFRVGEDEGFEAGASLTVEKFSAGEKMNNKFKDTDNLIVTQVQISRCPCLMTPPHYPKYVALHILEKVY